MKATELIEPIEVFRLGDRVDFVKLSDVEPIIERLCGEIETLKKANETATNLSNATIKHILNGRFVICTKGYEWEGLGFNTGYIESLEKGQQFTSNKAWRRADIEEVINFFLMPESAKPKGRYFI